MPMTKMRGSVLWLLLISYAASIFWGCSLGRKTAYGPFIDFEGVYYGTRCFSCMVVILTIQTHSMAGIVLTGDIFLAILLELASKVNVEATGMAREY